MLVNNNKFIPEIGAVCTFITRQGIEYMGKVKSFDSSRYVVEKPAIVTGKSSVKKLINSTEFDCINLYTNDIILCAKSSTGKIFEEYTLEVG